MAPFDEELEGKMDVCLWLEGVDPADVPNVLKALEAQGDMLAGGGVCEESFVEVVNPDTEDVMPDLEDEPGAEMGGVHNLGHFPPRGGK